MKTELTGKDRRHLRALGHDLDPVVQLGKQGLTDGVAAATDVALGTHELIKIKLGTECPDPPEEVAAALSASLGAHAVQVLGKTILLYRPNPQKRKIFLPGEPLPKAPANKAKSKPRRQRKPERANEEQRPRRTAARG